MRYLITFSYDGTNFHGYERQPNLRNIQEELERALTYINNHDKTSFMASGRTDKGVHALRQIGHVDINVSITEEKLKRAMNSLLPSDIHVISTGIARDDFHARYMAKEKVYQYILNMGEYNPMERNYVYQLNRKLDILKMEDAIKYFIGRHDFQSFTEMKEKRNNYIREIYDAKIELDNNKIIFTFSGNGFLKYQVRNMVGLLITIGLGKKEPLDVIKIIEKKDRQTGYLKAPAEGLYLVKVNY